MGASRLCDAVCCITESLPRQTSRQGEALCTQSLLQTDRTFGKSQGHWETSTDRQDIWETSRGIRDRQDIWEPPWGIRDRQDIWETPWGIRDRQDIWETSRGIRDRQDIWEPPWGIRDRQDIRGISWGIRDRQDIWETIGRIRDRHLGNPQGNQTDRTFQKSPGEEHSPMYRLSGVTTKRRKQHKIQRHLTAVHCR